MAKFFKDSDGKLVAALGDGVATPAGCTELTANTEDAAHEKHVPVVEIERDGHVIRARRPRHSRARGLDGAPHAARALHRVDRA